MKAKEVEGFIPAEKRVLVELVQPTTPSGLIETTDQSKDRGIVVGRGEECVKESSKVGTEILFNPYGTKEIAVNGRTVTMINEDQIYGRFKNQ